MVRPVLIGVLPTEIETALFQPVVTKADPKPTKKAAPAKATEKVLLKY